jgi:hypothetical protein
VLKSWKGPFSSGNVIHVAPNFVCTGGCGSPFTLQSGEEVLSSPIQLKTLYRWVSPGTVRRHMTLYQRWMKQSEKNGI